MLLTLEEPYLLSVSILSKNIYSYLKRLLKFFVLQLKLCHSRLNVEVDVKIQLSSIKPNLKKICKN